MQTVLMRAYRQSDVVWMIQIWNEVVLEGNAFPQTEVLDEASGATFFAQQSYCGVAQDPSGAILGLYILHPNNIGRCGHICNASYAVSAAARGRRIGEALVRDCLEQGKRLGFRILQFNAVVRTNRRARALYEKLGFVALGVIPQGFRLDDGTYADIVPYYRPL